MAERRSHLILLGLIIAALIGAALLAVPGSPIHKKPVLGLDLQGGTEVVLKAVPPRGEQVTAEGMDTAQSVMRRRVDKLGVTEPEIRKQGNDQMVIELAGVNPDRAQEVIGKTARLELFDLQGDLVPPTADLQGNPTPLTSLYNTLLPVQSQGKAKDSQEFYLFAPQKTPGSKAELEDDELQARCGAAPDREGASGLEVRARQRQEGRGAEGRQGDVRAGETRARQVHPGRDVLPERRPADEDLLLPLQVPPARDCGEPRDPGDDGVRPQPQGHPPGHRDAGLRERPADRAHGFHERGREEVPVGDANARRTRPDEVANGR